MTPSIEHSKQNRKHREDTPNPGPTLEWEKLEKEPFLKHMEMEFRKKPVSEVFKNFGMPATGESFAAFYAGHKSEQIEAFRMRLEELIEKAESHGWNNRVLFRKYRDLHGELKACIQCDGLAIIRKSKHDMAVSVQFSVKRLAKLAQESENHWDDLVKSFSPGNNGEQKVKTALRKTEYALHDLATDLKNISDEITTLLN